MKETGDMKISLLGNQELQFFSAKLSKLGSRPINDVTIQIKDVCSEMSGF